MLGSALVLLSLSVTAPAPPEAAVRPHQGVPTLFINGQPHPGNSYMTYNPQGPNFRAMGEIGVHLYSFSGTPTFSTYGLAEPVWLGPNDFDYTAFDERVKLLLDNDPEAFFFPRLYLGTPPWWADAHPDDLVTYDPSDGTAKVLTVNNHRVASWASETWRRETADALDRFIAHVESSDYADHVIGYHIASGTTEEWMQWGSNQDHWGDYSPVNVAAFREWLGSRYGDDEAIQAAWRDAEVTLATARVPSRHDREASERGFLRDPAVAQPSIDYAQYTSWLVTDTILYFAKRTKVAVDHKRLVGVFYGYVLQLAGASREQISGHHALQPILTCPDIDFVTSPTSYAGREMGTGYPHAMSLVDSIKLHGKLWFDENDFRTHLVEGLPPNFPGYTDTLDKTLRSQRRSFAWTFTERLGMWWFDMGGGWYDEPAMMDTFERMNRIAHANMDVDGGSVAEVTFVVDDHTGAYLSTSNPYSVRALVLQLHLLGHLGAPFDVLHVADLAAAPDYKLYIFPNLLSPREEDAEAVARKLSRGGAVLWLGPAGVYRAGKLAQENMQSVTGLPLELRDGETDWRVAPSEAAATWGWDAAATFDAGARSGVVATVPPSAGTVLGYFDGTELPALVAREDRGRLSVWSAIPMLPAAFLRVVAGKAGVHLYSDHEDVVWASKNLLAISVNEAGERTIALPDARRVTDLWTGEVVAESANSWRVPAEEHATLLYRLD